MTDSPANKSSTKLSAAIVTAVIFVVGLIFTFGQVFGNVKNLDDDLGQKADLEIVNAENQRIWDAVASNTELLKVQIANINENIALIQQDIRQLQIDTRQLAQSP